MFWINVNCIVAIVCVWQTFRLLDLVEQRFQQLGYVCQDGTDWHYDVKFSARDLLCLCPIINLMILLMLLAAHREEMLEEVIPKLAEVYNLKKKN